MAIKQKTKSLKAKGNKLDNTFFQLEVLSDKELLGMDFPRFSDKIGSLGYPSIKPSPVDIFQINIGKLCNQTCAHCHVDAGPDRKEENMDRATLEKCLDIIKTYKIPTVDITGGAPEMNAHFRWFVESCHSVGATVINRCNLTILRANPKYYDLPQFFKENKVHIVSSLPYFSKTRTDSQRGDGVFEDSIKALQELNKVGYGMPDSDLILDLVYNPAGAFLPGSQTALESQFKDVLLSKYNVEFNSLLAITNLPISRFLDYLLESGNYRSYMNELVEAFNPATMDGLMCRNTLSISWDGYIYDCDFNQMLDLKSDVEATHIDDFDMDALMQREIRLSQHCYGCTAGAGSSCGGEIAD